MPSKDEDTTGAAALTVDCTAVSGEPATTPGKPRSALSLLSLTGSSAVGGMVASGGDTSFFDEWITVTPSWSFATAGPAIGTASAIASTKIVQALSIFPLLHTGATRGSPQSMDCGLPCQHAAPRLPDRRQARAPSRSRSRRKSDAPPDRLCDRRTGHPDRGADSRWPEAVCLPRKSDVGRTGRS